MAASATLWGELEYDEARAGIPAADIPVGKRGLVHVYAKNTGTEDLQFRIAWSVKRPDGSVAERYSDTQSGTTGPGKSHEFIGGRFDIDMVEVWTIGIALADVNRGLLADYFGPLLTAVPPVEFSGFAISEYDRV